MLNERYRRLVRASALYDLLATAPFATPWSFELLWRLLDPISPLPAFAPMHVFFVNLLGSVVIVWSLLRLLRPEPIFGLFDATARGLFFGWQVYYLLRWDISPMVWGFAAIELALGVAQAIGYLRYRADARRRLFTPKLLAT